MFLLNTYYQNDHLGTPQRMVAISGAVVWEAEYTAFGKASVFKETVSNNLRFPGQYFDAESGLHHNFLRDFDPNIGRYIQSDPIGMLGGINLYGYGYQNPIMNFDPDGRLVWFIPLAAYEAVIYGTAIIGTGLYVASQIDEAADDWQKDFVPKHIPHPGATTPTGPGQDPDDEGCDDEYENPGHHDPKGGPNAVNSGKSTLPPNHQQLWNKSIRTNNKTRWAKEGSGKDAIYHRFQNDGRGGPFHWNGSTAPGSRTIPMHQVPNKVIKL